MITVTQNGTNEEKQVNGVVYYEGLPVEVIEAHSLDGGLGGGV